MAETNELITLIRSRTPLLVIETREELRVVDLLGRVAEHLHLPLYRWTVTRGLARLGGEHREHSGRMDASEVLHHIWSMQLGGLYLLLDFHPYLDDPAHVRMVKEIAQHAERHRITLIFISHAFPIPPELEHLAARFDLQLPGETILMQAVARVAGQWSREMGSRRPHIDKEALKLLVRNLSGLTLTEAARLARTAIYDDGAITKDDLPEVTRAKYALLNRGGVLSFEYNTARFSEVGGLQRFKQWLDQRRAVFTGSAEVEGLDKPKGILLLGVQGGGKSLAAKAVAGTWALPLLRLDFGTLYDKYFGETERRTREALKMAETMAPCVLWLDEIEKGVATGDNDGGTSSRLLGTLLTWMAEREAAVFMVATANDIQRLPPELLRKGRLDEIFFVDLPDRDTRREIFAIHLTKRGLSIDDFDLDLLAEAVDGFSGAEIEQAVVAGLYSALGTPDRLTGDLLLEEISGTRPLSVVMREQIAHMRAWAGERTVPAH